MLEDFIQDNSGKRISYDGVPENTGQSMQLIATWCKHIGLPFRWPQPADWWNDRTDDAFYDHWLRYEHGNDSVLPIPGDVVIFDVTLPGSYAKGHASIFRRLVGGGWEGFDSDWSGEAAHVQSHTWSHVRGWFTPKQQIQPPVSRAATMEPVQPARTPIAAPVIRPNSSDTVQVLFPIPKYRMVTDACNGTNATGTLHPNRYYIYRHLHGMLSITLQLGQSSGIWINPEDLKPKPVIPKKLERAVTLDAEVPAPFIPTYHWHDKIYVLALKSKHVLKRIKRI